MGTVSSNPYFQAAPFAHFRAVPFPFRRGTRRGRIGNDFPIAKITVFSNQLFKKTSWAKLPNLPSAAGEESPRRAVPFGGARDSELAVIHEGRALLPDGDNPSI